RCRPAGEPALRGPARRALERAGPAARADVPAGLLSHGEQRQLELAMALARDPIVLLLDEPAAGLGPEETQRMVALLRGLKDRHGILLVEHDMDAVYALADRFTVLDNGYPNTCGNPKTIQGNPGVKEAYLDFGGHV